MNFGKILKSKREECKLSQEEVAKRMGISQKTVSAWETGRNTPKLDDYAKMAKIYGCSIQELSGQKADISTITVQDILIKIPSLSIYELQEIHDHTEREIHEKERMLQILIEKEDLEKQLASLKARLEKYSHLEGGDSDVKS